MEKPAFELAFFDHGAADVTLHQLPESGTILPVSGIKLRMPVSGNKVPKKGI
ncbi:hypothetical protein [Paraburkholderia sp. D1E]|uniref:hypothetical protein n=1 Tax=Paraburkholderia sp. D1E TaxID=3461398 RepID=UPI004045BA59